MKHKMKAIINAKIFSDDKIIEGKVLLFDEKIVNVVDTADLRDMETVDANGAYVSAGFIDLHIHGSGGADVMDATPDALETISSTPSSNRDHFFFSYDYDDVK